MLQTSHSEKAENKVENKGDQIDSARDNRDRRPLGDHNQRNPSPVSKPVSRGPSPALQRNPSPIRGASPFRCDVENRAYPQALRDPSPHHRHRAPSPRPSPPGFTSPSPRPGGISPSPRPGVIRNDVRAASPWGIR